MGEFLEALGLVSLAVLAGAGLVVGGLLGVLTGRSLLAYAVIGALAAMATPFVLAALGVTVLAAGGLLLLLVVGAVGAAVVVGLVRAISARR